MLSMVFLQACSSSKTVDHFEKLEEPPEIVTLPSTEIASIDQETAITEGLGNNVSLLGKENTPIITVSMDFENTWQLLDHILKHEKMLITDRNRDEGYYLVSFDLDEYAKTDKGFLDRVNQSLFTSNLGIRKYQLTVRGVGKQTMISAQDLGLVTKAGDEDGYSQEIIDSSNKGPENSQRLILSAIYKDLHDGFKENDKD